jgi:AcrR family transcriptional regulator
VTRTPGRPRGARTKPPEQRVAELVEATIAAVRRCGPTASMNDIATEAGITKAVLYDHFASRDGLRRAVVQRYGEDLTARLGGGLGTLRTPQEVLRASVATLVRHVEEDPGLFRFVTQGSASLLMDAAPVFTTLIADTLRRAGRDTSASEIYAVAALGAVFTATDHWAASPAVPQADFVDQVCSLLWVGLGGLGLAIDEPVDFTEVNAVIAAATRPPDDLGPPT